MNIVKPIKLLHIYFLLVMMIPASMHMHAQRVVNPTHFYGEVQVFVEAQNVIVHWKTNANADVDYFVVEKSNNGKEFSDLAVVFAGDEVANMENYQYRDIGALKQRPKLYYRIRVVGANKIQFSSPLMAQVEKEGEVKTLYAYPNPVRADLTVQLPADWLGKKAEVQLYNSLGILIQSLRWEKLGEQVAILETGSLRAGAYIIRAKSPSETMQQLVIKN